MGKAARFACIFLPMIATLVSLFCCLSLLVAGTNKSIGALNVMYHYKVDTREIKIGAKDLKLQDFYNSYMWNYCDGSVKGSNYEVENCQKAKSNYAFNIEQVIDDKVDKNVVPDTNVIKNAQKAVTTLTKFMTACYVLGFIATCVTFVVGWFGLLSRWGSCVTTIFADVAFLFLLVASSCATAISYSLKGAFNKAYDEWGLKIIVGQKFMSVTWFCVAAALAASIFWTMSMCCCSGRTSAVMNNKKRAGTKAEHTGGYQRVASPYTGSTSSVPMQPYGARPGMEPMRHN
ncbi:SUR7/PalI family-domain-containing protein [Geopyxis carbonaria]|nr:SUR7/PalI family-domain-containing protein [Geopyxis carbonaria]